MVLADLELDDIADARVPAALEAQVGTGCEVGFGLRAMPAVIL